MQPTVTHVAPNVSNRGALAPVAAGAVVLALVMVVAGVPAVRLWTVEVLPPAALLEGIRMPAWLPRLGIPFGRDVALSYWVVETLAALVVLATYWYAARPVGAAASRGRTAGRVWVATLLAALTGCLVQAVLGSFLTADTTLPYLLLVGGTAVFAALWGALVGLLTCVAAAVVPQGGAGAPPATPAP